MAVFVIEVMQSSSLGAIRTWSNGSVDIMDICKSPCSIFNNEKGECFLRGGTATLQTEVWG
jgi:hypothetical protein